MDILIRSITNNSGNHDENYMDIKFNSEDDLSLKKTLELHSIVVVVRSVFQKATNIPHNFFDMIGLMHLTKLMLIKPLIGTSVLFAIS